jgi:adenine deaminase
MAVGADEASLLAALRRVEALGGGLVAVEGDTVRAELALPLGGLLTDAPLADVRDALDRLDAAAAQMGCDLPAPLMALSFLGLAVIPELKLTDHGLVDVTAGVRVPVPWGDAPG